jgi:hypothetical protein
MNYPAAELTGYQTALTALFFEAKLRGIHPKGLKLMLIFIFRDETLLKFGWADCRCFPMQ